MTALTTMFDFLIVFLGDLVHNLFIAPGPVLVAFAVFVVGAIIGLAHRLIRS